MDALIEQIISIINDYGYWGIFFGLALGIVGLPIPDEIGMTTVGVLIATNQINLSLTLAFLSALSGAVFGITTSYLLGIKLGYPLLQKYGHRFGMNSDRLAKTELFFSKWGSWMLPIGYFIPGVRHFTAYIAGMSKMPLPRFMAFAYLGAAFWCALFLGLGFLLGERASFLFEWAADYKLELMAVGALIVFFILYIRMRRKACPTE